MDANSKNCIVSSKFMEAVFLEEEQAILCKTLAEYVPMEEFQKKFDVMSEFIKRNAVKKFIFDKTSLKVFHQPSMEWYHIFWKKEMAQYGLKIYRKILPNLSYFKTSVKIGRERIMKEHPEFSFEAYDIQYCDTLEEALAL
ncbi:MAG: hypothetical protein SFU27_11195 [Thermonemataceae bacterium]|nr:hypothetical protein [Thermonemataceae bacterium]